jgi:hypothetical protein
MKLIYKEEKEFDKIGLEYEKEKCNYVKVKKGMSILKKINTLKFVLDIILSELDGSRDSRKQFVKDGDVDACMKREEARKELYK